jgi:hypothetical protein
LFETSPKEEHVAGELITLDEALLELESLIATHEPSWTGHWKAELANDLAAMLKPPDEPNEDGLPERYPPEVRAWHVGDSAEVWHNHQKAALFLRLQMEEGRPATYVRDPSDGELLPLLPEDWLPWTPKDRLAGDFLETGNYGVRGADGTRFYAQLQDAVVHRATFDAWVKEQLLYPPNRPKQREAVKKAVHALWGGYPPGSVAAKIRDRRIREWLASNGYEDADKYSTATIKRALSEIRDEQLKFKSPR